MKNLSVNILLVLCICSCQSKAQEESKTAEIADRLFSYGETLAAEVDTIMSDSEEPHKVDVQLNQQHRFELSPCEYKYNGKEFRLGGSIEDLIEVFGDEGRYARHGYAYSWDDYGFAVLCGYEGITKEITICFDCCEWLDPDDMEGTLPKSCFEGGVLIDGVLFGNGVTFKELEEQLENQGSKVDFHGFYLDNLYIYGYDCNYDGDIKVKGDDNHSFIIRTEGKGGGGAGSISISDSRASHKREMELRQELKEKE